VLFACQSAVFDIDIEHCLSPVVEYENHRRYPGIQRDYQDSKLSRFACSGNATTTCIGQYASGCRQQT
tara:strand:- start:1506 stop:1709 length:204 start_codon:yes stop_codon:yes gene_type:complete